MLLGYQPATAQDAEGAPDPEQAELQAAYEDAIEAAEQEREAALKSVVRARVEMEKVAEERALRAVEVQRARETVAEAEAAARAERLEERAIMRKELSRAHEELRRASREVARVHRELERPAGVLATSSLINLGDRAVIGVVLGESDDTGVHVLGVSPDGPAERAGIEQGDIIVSVMGERLVADGEEPARAVLHEVMEGVEVGDELLVTVARGDDSFDFTVLPERREPFGWQSMIRLPSVPEIAGAPVIVERIEIPEIDSEALARQMERLREDLERTKVVIGTRHARGPGDEHEAWELEFDNLSELGEEAMLGTNVWFGMHMTRGLKLAEINKGLGEYFKTDRGVLVLNAKEDNDLQLQSGDVILEVDGTEVNKPSDVMRALRDLEPGTDLEINVMRERRDRTIEVVVKERRLGFEIGPDFEHSFHYDFSTEED
jgi:C-terminal processing protease CtpA/Prc